MKTKRPNLLRRWRRIVMREWELLGKWSRAGLVSGLALAVITAAAWRPVRSWMREQRVEQRLDAAEKAYLAGDAAAAIRFLRSAQQMGAADKQIERLLADSLEAMQDPNALMAHARILEDPARNVEERLRSVRSVLIAVPFGDVRRLWVGLKEEERQSLDFRLAMLDRVIRDGDTLSALKFIDATQTEKREPDLELRRIRSWISRGDEESLDFAHRLLVDLWSAYPERRADWGSLLEEIPYDRLDALRLAALDRDLEAGLEGHPARAELLLARIRLGQAAASGDETARARILSGVMAAWKEKAPTELARFLEACGQWDALATEPVAGGAEEESLLRMRIHALARLGRTDVLAAELARAEPWMDSYWRNAWRATAQHHAGESRAAKSGWNLVLQEAEGHTRDEVFLELAAHALRQGMSDEHDAAMLAAIRRGRGPLPAFSAHRRLMERLERQGAESDLMMILARYRPYEPWDLELEARYCHLAALLGTEPVPHCISLLEAITREHPGMQHAQVVLACLHLLDGQPAKSVATWQSLSGGMDSLAPRFQAAWRVAALLAEQAPDDARQTLAVELPWQSLLPVERRLFRRYLRMEEAEPALPALPEARQAGSSFSELPPLPKDKEAQALPELPPLPQEKPPEPLPEVPPLPGS